MHAPSLAAAASLGARASLRNAWLAAVGFAVALLRRALVAPALAAAVGLLLEAARGAAAAQPLAPLAPLAGAAAAVGSPRFVGVVGGLWLAGSLLGAALRAAYLAGAIPALGGALAGEPDPPPRFAAGLAFGFPRVAGAAALAWVAELAGDLYLATVALGAVVVAFRAAAPAPGWLAAAAAAGLTAAVAVRLAVSVVADAAVARAALRGDGPARALGAAVARLLRRPGTFLLAGMAFGALGALAAIGVRSAGAVATGVAPGAGPLLAAGPAAMISLAGILVAAALDLWWLATVAVLATHEDRAAGEGAGAPPPAGVPT